VLQRVGDASLLGVQPLVGRDRALELSGEVLRCTSTLNQPYRQRRATNRQNHPHDRDDPGQPLWKFACQRLARYHH
jgi:hypothetical protein